MRDVYPTMKAWAAQGKRFALARVTSTWGSSPRRPGATMVVAEQGEVAGSVSGGCIEGEVIRDALASLGDGLRRVRTFGVESEQAWAVGLSCGGQVSVLIQPFDASSSNGQAWLDGLEARLPMRIETALQGTLERVELGAAPQESAVREVHGRPTFVHVIPRPSRLLIVGGADIAVHLTAMASRLDFEITVVDPRAVFADAGRFDVRPDSIETSWPQEVLAEFDPDEQTYAVLLTHEPRIDDAALHILLRSSACYIGALGGRKTQVARRQRLAKNGFSARDIGRIRGPVGIAIRASSPAQIAVSILAEIVAVQNGVKVTVD